MASRGAPRDVEDGLGWGGLVPSREERVVRNKHCTWSQIQADSDCWHASCGNEFQLNDGTPRDNNMKFCCYCGGLLSQRVSRPSK